GAEGVLPQREDEGDSERAGSQGRKGQRGRRPEEEDRAGEDARRSRRDGGPGAEAPGVDAADVGRGDRLAQLSRLADRGALVQEKEGEPGPETSRADPQRGSLRPREDQGPDSRVPRRPRTGEEAEGDDPDVFRPSGSRQDLARQVDRALDEPEVRPALARRGPGRGGDSRPSAYLHRRVPWTDHPDDEDSRDDEPGVSPGRGRQDVDGFSRRSVGRVA